MRIYKTDIRLRAGVRPRPAVTESNISTFIAICGVLIGGGRQPHMDTSISHKCMSEIPFPVNLKPTRVGMNPGLYGARGADLEPQDIAFTVWISIYTPREYIFRHVCIWICCELSPVFYASGFFWEVCVFFAHVAIARCESSIRRIIVVLWSSHYGNCFVDCWSGYCEDSNWVIKNYACIANVWF